MNAPTYILAKYVVRILNKHLTPNTHYSVTNCTNLAIDLTYLKIKENLKLITYDIKDLFVYHPHRRNTNNYKINTFKD